MLKTLKAQDENYKTYTKKLGKIREELYEVVDSNPMIAKSVELMNKTAFKRVEEQLQKEEKLQEEIMKSENAQLLFTDVVTTWENAGLANAGVDKILADANAILESESV